MTPEAIISLFNVLGWPILSMIGISWFLATRVWPWYTARVERIDERSEKQNAAFIAEITTIRESMAVISAVQRDQHAVVVAEMAHSRQVFSEGHTFVIARLDDLGRRGVRRDPAEVP